MMNQVSTFAISSGQTESPQKTVKLDTVYVRGDRQSIGAKEPESLTPPHLANSIPRIIPIPPRHIKSFR